MKHELLLGAHVEWYIFIRLGSFTHYSVIHVSEQCKLNSEPCCGSVVVVVGGVLETSVKGLGALLIFQWLPL